MAFSLVTPGQPPTFQPLLLAGLVALSFEHASAGHIVTWQLADLGYGTIEIEQLRASGAV